MSAKDSVHPLIFEFVRALPPAGTPLSEKRRADLYAALEAIVEVVYPTPPPAAASPETGGQ